MEDKSRQDPFSDDNLDSPEYRARLMRKLNCLVALLEVAISRVHQTLAGPDPDVERLERIRSNLQSTLSVCVRARVALEETRRAVALVHVEIDDEDAIHRRVKVAKHHARRHRNVVEDAKALAAVRERVVRTPRDVRRKPRGRLLPANLETSHFTNKS